MTHLYTVVAFEPGPDGRLYVNAVPLTWLETDRKGVSILFMKVRNFSSFIPSEKQLWCYWPCGVPVSPLVKKLSEPDKATWQPWKVRELQNARASQFLLSYCFYYMLINFLPATVTGTHKRAMEKEKLGQDQSSLETDEELGKRHSKPPEKYQPESETEEQEERMNSDGDGRHNKQLLDVY